MPRNYHERREPITEAKDANGEAIKVDDFIGWKDEAVKATFNKPAFGYGEGPFKISELVWQASDIMVKIFTEKGSKVISAKYFLKIK